MPERLKYHFEPKTGWMNDPNGLIFFKGRYHAFFQHYPDAPEWGPMHWGHCVSDDLIHWEELPIALRPDMPYEAGARGGCWSGSAMVKDDMLYLFYTSVSEKFGQTQSVACSKDGIHFEKYSGNPVIPGFPEDGGQDFRDPSVIEYQGRYYMVCGSGKDGVGRLLLYVSDDLLKWDYVGIMLEGEEYGAIIECPDICRFGDKFLLMFSQMNRNTHATMFVTGNFDGKKFTPEARFTPEAGPHFYAPKTLEDDKGRRILIGWLYAWGKKLDEGADYAGALSIPRELRLENGKLINFPMAEARHLLNNSDELVSVSSNGLRIKAGNVDFPLEYNGRVDRLDVLRDTKTIEVFINGGEDSFTYWFAK